MSGEYVLRTDTCKTFQKPFICCGQYWVTKVRFRENFAQSNIKKSNEGGDIMAHVISDECINCAACVDSCPVDAISESGDKHVIDADTCTDCAACVDTCPVDAISEA